MSVRGRLLLAQAELGLGLGLGERPERLLAIALRPRADEPVLGLDLAVAALRTLHFISDAFDLQPPLLMRRVVIGLERLGRLQRRSDTGGGERRHKAAATASSIRTPPALRHHSA